VLAAILSTTLFLVVMGDMMRRVIQNNNRGVGWGLRGRLEDLEYANKVSLLLQSCRGISEKICNLQAEANTA